MNMRKIEKNVLYGGKYVISVKVEIILSLNVRKYMLYYIFKMVMMIMMINGLWL